MPSAPAQDSPLLLSPEVRLDEEAVHREVDHEGPHGGIEHGAGEKLVRQVDGEEVRLTGPVQPESQTQTERLRQAGSQRRVAGPRPGRQPLRDTGHQPEGAPCRPRIRSSAAASGVCNSRRAPVLPTSKGRATDQRLARAHVALEDRRGSASRGPGDSPIAILS